jgi:hypothetical protein
MSTGPVVVAILSHRDPSLLQRLVKRVHEGRNTIAVVHHDPSGAPHGLTPSDRTFLIPNPTSVKWGRMSQAEAMLRCLAETRRMVPNFSWVLLVSGQDYPAQNLRHTERELAETNADAYLRWFPLHADARDDTHTWQIRCRQRYLRSIRVPGSRYSVPWPRVNPFGESLGLYIADTWINLRAGAVDHVLEQQARLRNVVRYLSWCSNPDEALLSTLLLNDANHLKIVGDRRRYIRWVDGQRSPKLLGLADLPALRTSGDFFARKFDSERTSAVLDHLDILAAGEQ